MKGDQQEGRILAVALSLPSPTESGTITFYQNSESRQDFMLTLRKIVLTVTYMTFLTKIAGLLTACYYGLHPHRAPLLRPTFPGFLSNHYLLSSSRFLTISSRIFLVTVFFLSATRWCSNPCVSENLYINICSQSHSSGRRLASHFLLRAGRQFHQGGTKNTAFDTAKLVHAYFCAIFLYWKLYRGPVVNSQALSYKPYLLLKNSFC